MVTSVPTAPLVGVKLVIFGNTWKLVVLVPVPAAVVTEIFPVVAVAGTVAVIWVSESTLKTEEPTPLNFTLVAPVKLRPVIVIAVPAVALVGAKLSTLGDTLKSVGLVPVPPGFVTLMGPVEARVGTVALREVAVIEPVTMVAATPLNFTDVTESRLVPL